jgi:hypothetical protein
LVRDEVLREEVFWIERVPPPDSMLKDTTCLKC